MKTLISQSTQDAAPVLITARLWRPSEEPITLSLEHAASISDGLLLLTVDAAPGDVENVHLELKRICGDQLTHEMVTDLLETDELPICHWQPCNTYQIGDATPCDVEPLSLEELEREIARLWLAHHGETAGDLGVLFLYVLALQYTKARRVLWSRLNAWELDFYNLERDSDPTVLVQELRELHRLHRELNRRLDGLNVPRDGAEVGWFANVARVEMARTVDKIIDHSLHNLRSFNDSLRQAVGLTQSYATLKHFEVAAKQTKETEKLQHGFQLVASVLLVPTLVAGIYGANTLLPGGGHWSGFIAMVILMVLGSGAMYFSLDKVRRSGST